jgi:hypothetical protein
MCNYSEKSVKGCVSSPYPGTSCQQDYDAMVKLVETLEMLPTCDLADQHNIKFHYAFALNR